MREQNANKEMTVIMHNIIQSRPLLNKLINKQMRKQNANKEITVITHNISL
jgi:hypothetical protein